MSNIRVLHLWGLDGKPSLVSPESVALIWLLHERDLISSVDVVFSNNVDCSPTGELPVLIDQNGKKTAGFYSIVENLYDELKPKQDLLSNALLQYTYAEFGKYTMFQLYLNSENYNGYTSKIFSYLLHWPFWYNTPLSERSRAKEMCEELMTTVPDSELDNERTEIRNKATELAQSQVFKVTRANDKKHAKQLQELKATSRYTAKLDPVLDHWEQARSKLAEPVLPADLLLAAHLKTQMELPKGSIIEKHISSKFPSLYSRVSSIIKQYDSLTVKSREPTFIESGNLLTSAIYAIKTLL